MRDSRIRLKAVTIDQEQLGQFFKLINCKMHGHDGGIQDIDLINL